MKYEIVYADPPWKYTGKIRPNTITKFNNVNEHYPVMDLSDIIGLPVRQIVAEDSLLFLWATGPCLPDAIETCNRWGFKYGTVAFVWNKINPLPGSYTISQVEFCIVGRHGKIPQPRGARNIRQLLQEKKTIHSKKPNEIRERIQKMFPLQKKIELFAREKVQDWDSWGNELKNSSNIFLDKPKPS